jgi:hypothetical protein
MGPVTHLISSLFTVAQYILLSPLQMRKLSPTEVSCPSSNS